MSIKSDLKKDGIEIIEKLDTLAINSIAKNISSKLCATFPNFGLDETKLFINLSRLDMYVANMPEGMAEANYFYKNKSIYFNSHIPAEDREEFAIHECIHYIQEVTDKKNYLIRMGLCDYSEFKIYGLALNEAAVQLMSSKIIGIEKDFVKYYGISFETISPSYYPVECSLVNQLAYLFGEDVLFESTINSNDNFKNKVAKETSLKTFYSISNALDSILNDEESIIKYNNKILENDDRNSRVDRWVDKINELKENIKVTYFRTQNLIISSYFDNAFDRISTLEDVENYRRKLYTFKDYIATSDGYTYFNNYYIEAMNKLEHKYNMIENGGIETAVSIKTKEENLFISIIKSIKKLVLSMFGLKNDVKEK